MLTVEIAKNITIKGPTPGISLGDVQSGYGRFHVVAPPILRIFVVISSLIKLSSRVSVFNGTV
jgi:hypothetical protein